LHLKAQPVDLFSADQKYFIMSSSTNTVQAHNKEKKEREKGKGKMKEEGKNLILLKIKVNLESLNIISDVLGSSQDFLCFYLSVNSLSDMFSFQSQAI